MKQRIIKGASPLRGVGLSASIFCRLRRQKDFRFNPLRGSFFIAHCSLFIVLFTLLSCAHQTKIVAPPPAPPPVEERAEKRLTLVAVGDNLIHLELIKNARAGTETEDDFYFDGYYSEVKPFIESADIAFINQETLIAGPEFGYSGYPAFNGPAQLGDTLERVGFNVVNHATNHAMDKGEKAVFAVMDFWDTRKDMLVLGIHRSQVERDTKKNIIEKNNIAVGFLSYSYGLNGIALPKDKPFLVSLIDTEIMAKEIDALRPLCDFLVVSMHWGNEYEHTPTKRQEELARFLAEHRVDLVIGHHPHVLQPIRAYPRENMSPMICYFSLGNFLSGQNESPRLLGGMMRVTLKKSIANNAVTIEEAELIPLVTHYERPFSNFKVYPLHTYSEVMAEKHHLRGANKDTSLSYFEQLLKDVFGSESINNIQAGK